MGALEQMDGFAATHKGAGGLAELDLATGAVRRVVMAPADGAPHLLGDFVQLADGTIYATDTTSPIIWTLAPGGSALVPLVNGGFKSLQGITLDADARGLFVTDYRVGVLHVDIATKAVRPLTAPAGADLRGLDTLLRTPDGALVAIFNATPRQRILRLTLDAAATAITASTSWPPIRPWRTPRWARSSAATWSSSPTAAGTGSSRGRSTRARGRCRC